MAPPPTSPPMAELMDLQMLETLKKKKALWGEHCVKKTIYTWSRKTIPEVMPDAN